MQVVMQPLLVDLTQELKISMVKLSDGVLITKIILPTDLLGIYSSLPAIQLCILMPMPDQTT